MITSIALGAVAGSAEQPGAVPPGAHTPNVYQTREPRVATVPTQSFLARSE